MPPRGYSSPGEFLFRLHKAGRCSSRRPGGCQTTPSPSASLAPLEAPPEGRLQVLDREGLGQEGGPARPRPWIDLIRSTARNEDDRGAIHEISIEQSHELISRGIGEVEIQDQEVERALPEFSARGATGGGSPYAAAEGLKYMADEATHARVVIHHEDSHRPIHREDLTMEQASEGDRAMYERWRTTEIPLGGRKLR